MPTEFQPNNCNEPAEFLQPYENHRDICKEIIPTKDEMFFREKLKFSTIVTNEHKKIVTYRWKTIANFSLFLMKGLAQKAII